LCIQILQIMLRTASLNNSIRKLKNKKSSKDTEHGLQGHLAANNYSTLSGLPFISLCVTS
jgi:hypothetical protein